MDFLLAFFDVECVVVLESLDVEFFVPLVCPDDVVLDVQLCTF